MLTAARHRCMIYAGSAENQLPYIAMLLAEQLRLGARCFYLNSPETVELFKACLSVAGIDVEQELRRGTLLLSSERSHLAEGRFDSATMLRSLSALIARAYADGFEKVWASGDMTWEMGNQGNLAELLEYERGLERLFQLHPGFSGVCQYHRDTLPTSAIRDALCSHQSVYLNQTLFRLNPYYEEAEIPAGVPTELQDLIERFRQHQ